MCASVNDEHRKAVMDPDLTMYNIHPILCFLGQQEVTVGNSVILCGHHCVTASKSDLVHQFARLTQHRKMKIL